MTIQILCDNPHSWMTPYAKAFANELQVSGLQVLFTDNPEEIVEGDILIMLSCEKIFKKLALNKNNLVVHESALPQGKGWSPLTWQIVEGENEIPVTLFEASERVDAGIIYGQEIIQLNGTELVDELREKQAEATFKLLKRFISNYPNNIGKAQEGAETFYPKRTLKDSEINIHKTIEEQLNLLRVCDNDRYPAWFSYLGTKYIIKIYKQEE